MQIHLPRRKSLNQLNQYFRNRRNDKIEVVSRIKRLFSSDFLIVLKYLVSLFILLLFFFGSAQKSNLRIGIDLGVRNYNLIEDLANNNQYSGTSFSIAIPSLYWLKEKSFSSLSLGLYGASLQSEIDNSNFTADLNEIEIGFQYLWRFYQKDKFSFFAGPGTRPYVKYYDQQFRGSSEINVLESSVINLNLSVAASMQANAWQLFFLTNLGIFQYWTKAIPFGEGAGDYQFQTDFIGDFLQIHFSFFGIYKLSKRWEFQPKYNLGYYDYKFQNELTTKVLAQSWTLGFYYLLAKPEE